MKSAAAFALLAALLCSCSATLPVVLWHGMGDTCCNPISMGSVKKMIQSKLDNVYVHSIEIGSSQSQDAMNGFFKPIDEQIKEVCDAMKADENLKGGFNAIGFSQGSQFLRAYVQRCNDPPVHNLISIGGQHQGVFGMPRCLASSGWLCDEMRKLLNMGAYVSFVQDHLVQAQYWKDPLNYDEYLSKNVFLPDINNELDDKNDQYKTNLMSLNTFVMVKFNNDTMVQPRDSEWFGFYKLGQDKEVETLQESKLYQEDYLGLQEMDKQGKLHFLATDGEHLQMPEGYFEANIIPYLQ
uniref:Palmitoyl-protein thioesterase 1 n=1 Tax=Palpitomonas bilix TaxID=652834 RepID=A0A7S3DD21_9EUKA|mmetsp:Transcript_31784/g.82938  ORF Transcript_31784/g.82938 Transcript_31784/m.82938 type:complete len:296 (+) Transcript_31784:135-1022(+)